MIKSMTGYGSAKGVSDKLEITVELRSVNNRFLDCNVRIPRVYTCLEDAIKARVQQGISRGKVDVYVTIDASGAEDTVVTVNEPVADAYVAAIRAISEKYGVPNDLTATSLARMQDVLTVTKAEADVEKLGRDIVEILSRAMDDFNAMREREGVKLHEDIASRADEVERLVGLAEERSPETVKEYRERLYAKLTEVLESTSIDEGRVLTEAAIFADKVAVAEETVRLRSHISQLRDMINSDEPVGRKLDFLVQEFNREANTMGSKGNDLQMAKIVVDMKAEIEKIREQIQNVE